MVRELERLLSNCYVPNDNICYSAIVKCKDKMTFGGVAIKNNIFRGYITAEEAAISNAIAHGYKKNDLESIYIMVSTKNINDLKNISKSIILEFFNLEDKIYLYDINRNERILKVGNLLNNIY